LGKELDNREVVGAVDARGARALLVKRDQGKLTQHGAFPILRRVGGKMEGQFVVGSGKMDALKQELVDDGVERFLLCLLPAELGQTAAEHVFHRFR
jgi:hypothetical protein